MNFHDSERMAGLLEAAGYEAAADASDADVIVVNTCAVREKAEDKIFSRIGELRADAGAGQRAPVVAVVGCLAQQDGGALFKRSPFINVIVGAQAEKRLPALVEEAARTQARQLDITAYEDVSFPLGLVRRSDPVKAYVTIIEGCNDYCAYCVVPYTRGHERMRPLQDVLAEVREAADTGHREVQLLGQIVNHYQAPDDAACDFAALLKAVDAIPGIERIRFASPHPRHVTPRLLDAMADLPHVCKHLHLPVQSGSTRILEAMRRRHTRDEYLSLIDDARVRIPGIQFSTDMIVGFPGELDTDFADSVSLVERVQFHSMFSFKYSERPNTLAANKLRDDVPEDEKGRRLSVLQERQATIQTALHQLTIGSDVEVLVEHASRRREAELSGRTSGNTIVNFPGRESLLGTLVRVRIERAGPHSLWGQIIGEALTEQRPTPTL
jgi:tRNA-2-methylthio-N6-dimethylallyladenosine synthase